MLPRWLDRWVGWSVESGGGERAGIRGRGALPRKSIGYRQHRLVLWWAKERVWSVGGLLRFRKKREGGNEMTPIDAEAVQLVLVDSMLPKNTGRMIEKVKRLQDVLPESVECLFDGIEGLVSSVTREGRLDGGRLREAVEMNQCLLQALGVSCEAIDEIVRVSRQCHFAAKLTGGGGGGCVIAVASDEAMAADKELLLKSLRERGYEVQQVRIGGKGVEVEIM